MVAAFVLLSVGTIDWAAGEVETTSRQVAAHSKALGRSIGAFLISVAA